MKPVQFEYHAPEALELAWAFFTPDSTTKWLGGGQSLGPMLNLRLARPDALVQLAGIAALTQVETTEHAICYGAMLRHADFEDGRVPDATGGMLQEIASGIAYRAIRNRGTLGGSLAHADPAADWVNTMIALNVQINVSGSQGPRSIAATDFMLAAFTTALMPGELIVSIQIPKLLSGARWGYYKFCRKTGEFSQATATVVVDPQRGYARVVLGALDGAPLLLEDLAELLAQQGVDAAMDQAGNIVNQYVGTMPEYRRQLYVTAVNRALMQIKGVL